MKKKGLSILLLDQGRQSLPFLKSYNKSGHKVITVCNSILSETFFSRYPSKRLMWPSYVTDRSGFEKTLLDYVRNNKVDVTVSVGDISSEILSRNKEEIKKYTRITSPEYSIFIQAADKLKLMNYCMANNLPCPKTFELNDESIRKIDKLLNYPIIVKPIRGVGAVGLRKFDNHDELISQFHTLQKKYGSLLAQEYIPQTNGMQYQAEAFCDNESKLKVCMVIKKPRFFPINGGTSTANVTIDHPKISEITKALLEGLKWVGPADVDYILDPRNNEVKILEINPRVTAGIKIGFTAGIDYADLHLKLALGQPIPLISYYKKGVYCRNIILEFLWFLFSNKKMKKETQPSLFVFFGKNVVDQVFSIDDPLAGFGFILNMTRKYLNFSNFKSKFHK